MIQFRDRGARGRHRGAMVDAYHSFSFADFNDPRWMGFRDLRVLNEDIVMPGVGLLPKEQPVEGVSDRILSVLFDRRAVSGRHPFGRPGPDPF